MLATTQMVTFEYPEPPAPPTPPAPPAPAPAGSYVYNGNYTELGGLGFGVDGL